MSTCCFPSHTKVLTGTRNAQAGNGWVEYQDLRTRIGTFPIGISPSEFNDRLHSEGVRDWMKQLESHYNDTFLYLGVDRLDYIKGVPQKLQAFDRLLQKNPERKGKISMLQVVVPSRGDADEYHKLRLEIQDLVSEINGKHGKPGGTFSSAAMYLTTLLLASTSWIPIMYLHKSVPPPELTALYSIAGALVVSSTRDGMNLVCYEYVACRVAKDSVVILSRFAGAAETLPGCILVNPWNAEEHAEALEKALTIGKDAREDSQRRALEFVHNNTAYVAKTMPTSLS